MKFDKEINDLISELKDKLGNNIVEIPEYAQEPLPENWMELVTEAKIQHDKWGAVCENIVLPASWSKDFINKAKLGELKFVTLVDGTLGMWGADLTFGVVHSPVASSNYTFWK